MSRSLAASLQALLGLLATGCAGWTRLGGPRRDSQLSEAWSAWERGDMVEAARRGAALAERPETADPGHFVLALVAHARGEHAQAIAHHGLIRPGYRWLNRLEEPVLWSHLHLGDVAGAVAFAEARAVGRDRATRERLRMARERPLRVELQGLVELPFTDDALSPLMPGFPARVAGKPVVARLDTGGSYLHLSSEMASALGIRTGPCDEDFASLARGKVCYGVTDLELGAAQLANVPVAVHHGALPTRALAQEFGVELGPIVGTAVLQQFLVTLDGPGRRMLLSRRGEAAARAAHLARVPAGAAEVPFALWGSHLMVARATLAGAERNFFVDTGLVAANREQGQVELLAPATALRRWGAPAAAPGHFAEVPGELALGGGRRARPTAFEVPDGTWADFGDFGGIRVEALVSWGALRRFTWTIDFEARTYRLTPG